jgi:hypothetical protein
MNGRLYDPLLRRFLNADENIQDPYNTQNYNKYGYVLNNPLMYNDTSGEFLWVPFLLVVAKGALIGAAIGAASYVINAVITNSWSWGGFAKSVFFGAVGGAFSAGIGEIFQMGSVVKALGEASFLVQSLAHGVSQGVLSVMQGSDFLSGAAAGFLGSLGASGWSSVMGTSGGAMIAFGALAGGVGAELTGGNFWQGAITGGIVAGLNHAMHEMVSPLQKTPQQKEPWDTNGDGKISLDEANNWYRNGKGQAITVDASRVDLNSVDKTGWVKGKTYGVQTLLNSEQGRVLGNITVKYLGNNQVKILQDTYNFEQHGSYWSSPIRNPANSIGRWWAGKGTQYDINFRGINTIRPKVYNFERGPKY